MNPTVRRRVRYIDRSLQRHLIGLLVVVELVLVVIALAVLYARWRELVEASLYRIHFDAEHSLASSMWREAVYVTVAWLVANLALLVTIEVFWIRRVHRIVRDFKGLIGRSEVLDFTEDSVSPQHPLLAVTLSWRGRQRERYRRVRDAADRLAAGGVTSEERRRALEEIVHNVR